MITSKLAYSKECTPEQTLPVQKNSKFVLPSGCYLSEEIIEIIEYQHSISYGNTDRAFELMERYRIPLLTDFTIRKVHILNLHGMPERAIELLNEYSKQGLKKSGSYYAALSETHLKLGQIKLAQKYFKIIDVDSLPSRIEYELVRFELLFHENKYKELYKVADFYLAERLKSEKASGLDYLVLTYTLLGACKLKDNPENEKLEQRIFKMLNVDFAPSSIYHKEVKRIASRCH